MGHLPWRKTQKLLLKERRNQHTKIPNVTPLPKKQQTEKWDKLVPNGPTTNHGASSDLGRNYSTGGLSSPCEKKDENEALTLAPSPNKNQQPHPQDQAVKNETENSKKSDSEISSVQEGYEVNVASSTLQGTSNQTESTSTHQTKQATPSVSLEGDYHEQEEKEDKKVYATGKPVVSVTSSTKFDLQAMKTKTDRKSVV